MTERYAPNFEAFVAPARRRPALWRLILGTILALAVYVAVAVAVIAGAVVATGALGSGADADEIAGMIAPDDPAQTALLLLTFVGMAAGAVVAAAALHRRGPGTLFGPGAGRNLRHFATCFAIVGGAYGAYVLVSAQRVDFVENLPMEVWLSWLVPALVLVLIQVSAEEMLFRGYLMQQLAARFASPVIWAGLPALLFGMGHFNPAGAADNAWLVVGATFLFGLVAADLTARSGALGGAIGFHFANNVFALLLVATDGTITGLALYATPYSITDIETVRPLILIDGLVMVAAWLACRRAVRR